MCSSSSGIVSPSQTTGAVLVVSPGAKVTVAPLLNVTTRVSSNASERVTSTIPYCPGSSPSWKVLFCTSTLTVLRSSSSLMMTCPGSPALTSVSPPYSQPVTARSNSTSGSFFRSPCHVMVVSPTVSPAAKKTSVPPEMCTVMS